MTRLRVPIRVKVQVTVVDPRDESGAGRSPDVEWVQDATIDLLYNGLKGQTDGEVLSISVKPR